MLDNYIALSDTSEKGCRAYLQEMIKNRVVPEFDQHKNVVNKV